MDQTPIVSPAYTPPLTKEQRARLDAHKIMALQRVHKATKKLRRAMPFGNAIKPFPRIFTAPLKDKK